MEIDLATLWAGLRLSHTGKGESLGDEPANAPKSLRR